MPRIALDNDLIEAEEGDTVAEALLRAGVTTFSRSIKYHRPRGPFCFSGSCGQCLMRIDGAPSQLACRVKVAEGMRCERQNVPFGADTDLLRAADFLFADGLDHHHLLTGSRILGRVALEVARRLAGLGELPTKAQPTQPAEVRAVRLAIIGGGEAGRAALRAAPDAVLLERAEGSSVVGLYTNDTKMPGNALVVVRRSSGLLVLAAEKVIVANGGAPQPLPFPGVDRPGVYAARGLVSLRVKVGEKLVVAGLGEELREQSAALRKRGYEVLREVDGASKLRALGDPVKALEVDGERIRCDAVAIAVGPAPLHELASSVGAIAHWDSAAGGFPVQVDAEQRTSVPWLYAAGRVCGQGGSQAAASGERAGAACRA
jgi:sarcosine oxidase subunit alpha